MVEGPGRVPLDQMPMNVERQIDVCDESWDALVDELAVRSLGLSNRVVLSHDPIPWTLEVTVDGAPIDDWRLDAGSVVVLLPMEGGERIEVRYTPWAECG